MVDEMSGRHMFEKMRLQNISQMRDSLPPPCRGDDQGRQGTGQWGDCDRNGDNRFSRDLVNVTENRRCLKRACLYHAQQARGASPPLRTRKAENRHGPHRRVSERVYPVGRLDYDTEGLLILTNDGDFAYRSTHPRHQVNKTYIAEVVGEPSRKRSRS